MPAAGVQNWSKVSKGANQAYSSNVNCLGSKQVFTEPNQEVHPEDPMSKEIVQNFRDCIVQRGARGIVGLRRCFKVIDDNGSKTLDFDEFYKGLCDFRIKCDKNQGKQLFDAIDVQGNGAIDYDEFLRIIVGPMNEARKQMVKNAFTRFDKDGNGRVNIEDIKSTYDASLHPEVKSGIKTEEEILGEFLDTFEMHHSIKYPSMKDRSITLEEFIEYYNNISCSIDNDEYFELMITNTWNLNNKNYSRGWMN